MQFSQCAYESGSQLVDHPTNRDSTKKLVSSEREWTREIHTAIFSFEKNYAIARIVHGSRRSVGGSTVCRFSCDVVWCVLPVRFINSISFINTPKRCTYLFTITIIEMHILRSERASARRQVALPFYANCCVQPRALLFVAFGFGLVWLCLCMSSYVFDISNRPPERC